MLGGLCGAALTYLPYALTPAVTVPLRTQLASAPGIGLFLAAVALALVRPLPAAGRIAALAILAGWVVAGGTGRTLLLQREWDRAGLWPAQSGTLRELVRLAPDLVPNTFVLLFDETDTWKATFTFRHAVDYVYDGRAIGAVWGAHPFLYPFAFTPVGLVSEPWPVIHGPWGVRATLHGYHEIVLARLSPSGFEILETWPDGALPALPAGAAYDPEARVVRGGAVPRTRAILDAQWGNIRRR